MSEWQEKDAEDRSGLRLARKKPPVDWRSVPGRRQSPSLSQYSHPTLVVAGVDILRRASAHKRSPLFRRRTPAGITVRPEGSPGGSPRIKLCKAPGDPSAGTEDTGSRMFRLGELARNPPSRQTDRGCRCGRAHFAEGAGVLGCLAGCEAGASRAMRWSSMAPCESKPMAGATCVPGCACCRCRCGLCRTRQGGRPCKPDRSSRTRTVPSSPCAAAWRPRTAGRPALRAA